MAPFAVQYDSMITTPLCNMEQAIEPLRQEETKRLEGRAERRICFADVDQIQEVDHIYDMPEEEISAIYTSPEELAAIKSRCKLYIQAMNDSAGFAETVCLRGLEGYAPVNVRRRKFIRNQLYDAVDEIQAFHDKTGLDVSDLMAQICEKFSKSSVLEAQDVGVSDFLAATYD